MNQNVWYNRGMNSRGVYMIRNNKNRKIYVGSTSGSFKTRRSTHERKLRKETHENQYLQRAWNKYGEDTFVFLILEDMPDATPEEIIEAEQWYLDNVKTHSHNAGGYNIALDAKAPMGGRKFTEEHKAKIGKANSGKNHYLYGKHPTAKALENMSKAQFANWSGRDAETRREKISGKNSGMYGRQRSVKTKAKIGRASSGENNSNSKLTAAGVMFARFAYLECGISYRELSKHFEVDFSTMRKAVLGKTWKHL